MSQAALTPTNTAYQLAVENTDSRITCYYPSGDCYGDYDHALITYLRGLVKREAQR